MIRFKDINKSRKERRTEAKKVWKENKKQTTWREFWRSFIK